MVVQQYGSVQRFRRGDSMNDLTPISQLERCRQWIEDALAYCGGTHEWEDIEKGIMEGRMQLWPAPKGCIVTEIVVYPRKRVLNIFLAGGELDQILDMDTDVKAWAKEQNCTAAIMAGRIGWKKPLAPLDWKMLYASFIKEI